jgi:putative DNA primase/helicase
VSIRQAATEYARRGWQVIPVWWVDDGRCGCGDPHCTAPGKHPLIQTGKGLVNASDDAYQVERWWEQWPRANVAVACGTKSGIVVIDCDMHEEHDGHLEFLQWCADRGIDPNDTLVAETGGGGRHVVFTYPEGVPIKNAVGWLEHVDVRSDGGYVLMAPSTHVSGGAYRWLSARGTQPTPPPLKLASALSTARSRVRPGVKDAEIPAGYDHRRAVDHGPRVGERDHFFNARAFELKKAGVDKTKALEEMRAHFAMTEQGSDPFPWEMVEYKVDRVWEDPDITVNPDYDAELQRWARNPGVGPRPSPKIRLLTDDPSKVSYTDTGNAWRLIEYTRDKIRWSAASSNNGFLVWDGVRWAPDELERVRELSRETIDNFNRGISEIDGDERREKASVWANISRSKQRTDAMITQVQTFSDLKMSLESFDSPATELLLTVPNGIIDLTTGELQPHDPRYMITRMSFVEYDPNARDHRWETYLKTVTDGDEDLAHYLQRAVGYTLTGSTREEILFMLHGPPASGKSTFVTAIQTVLGEYAYTTQAENLMHRRGRAGGPPKDEIASWRGARLLASVEPTEGDRWDESLIKQLTGGDRVVGRHLYKERFEFKPTYKLWLAANSAPRTRDEAMFRRIRRVPFPVRIPRANRDLTLKDWLTRPTTAGARAVLAWAVEGARTWYTSETGVGTCKLVESDTEEYRTEQDVIAQFIEDCLRVHGNKRQEVRISDVYEIYKTWIDRMGEKPWAQITFTRKLKDIQHNYKYEITHIPGKSRMIAGADVLPGGAAGTTWEAGGVS